MIKQFIKRILLDCKKIDNEGFWFPRFTWTICFLHNLLSPRQWRWVEKLLNKFAKDEPSKSEIYQSIWVVIGAIWLLLIKYPMLTGNFWMYLGAGFALYRPLDIFLFTLDWLFVKENPVKSFRRSLSTFLLNMVEIGIYFSIVYILFNSSISNQTVWITVMANIKAVFVLEKLSGLSDNTILNNLGSIQLVLSWFLYVVILANVVGSLNRTEDSDHTQGKTKPR